MFDQTFSIIDASGSQQEVRPSLEWYGAAFEAGLSLPQYLQQAYPTNADRDGTAFEQILAGAGFVMQRDPVSGLRPPPMSRIVGLAGGGVEKSQSTLNTRPDGSQALTVAGRLLFPAVIGQWIESQLMEDWTSFEGAFNRMIALTESVNSPRVDIPIVNLTAPRSSIAQPIAQGAEPATMLTISLSDKSYRIPTYGIGLEITDEATRSATIDFVGMTLQQQIIGQRIALVNHYLKSLILGDSDLDMSALSSEAMSGYDSAATGGTMTNKAWVKWLRKDWAKLTIDWVICDIDTYLDIENRTGRPTIFTDAGQDIRLTSIPTAVIPGIPGTVNFFILQDASLLGAKTFVGLDSKRAIKKYVYVGAQYSAVEAYVMRRTSAMRFDFGEMSTRMYYNGDGWKKAVYS